MKKLSVCIIILIFSGSALFADGLKDISQAKTVLEKTIQTFTDGNLEQAMDMVRPYWGASPDTIDTLISQTQKQLSLIKDNYGTKVGVEFIKEVTAGDSLVKLIYLEKLTKFALKFEVILYRTPEGWKIVSFLYNDKLSELLN